NDTAAVRRQVAVDIRGEAKTAPLWAMLAQKHDGKGRWYLGALGIGAAGNEDACFDAWLAAVGTQWNTPAGRDIVWRMRATKSAVLQGQILEDNSIPDNEKQRYLRAFDFLPRSDEKRIALLQVASGGKASGNIA